MGDCRADESEWRTSFAFPAGTYLVASSSVLRSWLRVPDRPLTPRKPDKDAQLTILGVLIILVVTLAYVYRNELLSR